MAKYYLLVDETGSMANQLDGKEKKLILSIVKLSNEDEEYNFNKFVDEYNSFMEKECGKEKKHLYELFQKYEVKVAINKVQGFIENYKHFIKTNILNLSIDVGYYSDSARSVFHTIDSYVSSLYYLFYNSIPFIRTDSSEVFYIVEDLQYLRTLQNFLQEDHKSLVCQKFQNVLRKSADVYDIDEKISSIVLKDFSQSKKLKRAERKYLVVADLFASGQSFLKSFSNYIKLKKLPEPYIPLDKQDSAYQMDVSLTGKYRKFNFSVKSNLNVIFGSKAEDRKLQEIISSKLGITKENIPFSMEFRIKTDFDENLVNHLVNTADELNFSIKSQDLNSRKAVLTKYIKDIAILGKLDLINISSLRENFGVLNLPEVDLSKKYSEGLSVAEIISLLLEAFYKESYDRAKLSALDGYPLIKYVYMSNVAYKNPYDEKVLSELQELEKNIENKLLSLLNYDAIHQRLNNLYINGDFQTLSQEVEKYKDILIKRLEGSAWVYKRRYLNLFAKVFSEFYKLDTAESIYRYIVKNSDDLSLRELYRTKGSLAETLSRRGNYNDAIQIYLDNLNMDLSQEESIRTKSQLLYPLFFEYMKDKDQQKHQMLEEFLFDVELYYDENKRQDILYVLLLKIFFEGKNSLPRNISDFKSRLYYMDIKDTDPLNLPVAIFEVVDGKVDDAIQRLEKAGFIFELADLLNSKFVDKKVYSVKLKDIKEKLNKNWTKNIEDVLKDSSLWFSENFHKKFLDMLFNDRKQELITFRMNLLNYLPDRV